MPTEGGTAPFLSQMIEVERALDNLAKSGKLHYYPRTSAFTPPSQNVQQTGPRFSTPSYYASQRAMSSSSSRARSSLGGPSNYYSPPPPLQQQYTQAHQPSSTYPGQAPQGAMPNSFTSPTYEHEAFAPTFSSAHRYDGIGNSQDRAFPPFSFSTSSLSSALPSVGSAPHNYPPGYGSGSNSRAPSISGSLSGSSTHLQSLHHSRTQSHSNMSDSGRTLNGISAFGKTSPIGHSRAPSISGSASSPAPSSASFNFFGPTITGASSMQSSATSSGFGPGRDQKIAPIGRPAHSKTASSETIGSSRLRNNSGHASGMTSPLGVGLDRDPWLGSPGTGHSSASSTIMESNSHSTMSGISSVWN